MWIYSSFMSYMQTSDLCCIELQEFNIGYRYQLL